MESIEAFEKGMILVRKFEGGHVNDPADPGGETYCGISRRYFPGWRGWAAIPNSLNRDVNRDLLLRKLVDDHYQEHFWNRFQGDTIAAIDPDLAIEVFEQSIHLGVHRAVKHLQQALNYLNRGESIYKDLDEDGLFGKKTRDTIIHLDAINEVKLLRQVLNIIQGAYYLKRMKARPINERYIGWFGRVKL